MWGNVRRSKLAVLVDFVVSNGFNPELNGLFPIVIFLF